jgi:hypothetical protein
MWVMSSVGHVFHFVKNSKKLEYLNFAGFSFLNQTTIGLVFSAFSKSCKELAVLIKDLGL